MRLALLLFSLLFAFIAAEEDMCPLMKALQKSFEECVESLKPSEETLKFVTEQKGEDTKEVNCFHACMVTKAGMMENAKMQFDKMEELLKSADKPDEEKINAIMSIMKECKDESEVSADECEVAGNYAKCVNARKEALKDKQ